MSVSWKDLKEAAFKMGLELQDDSDLNQAQEDFFAKVEETPEGEEETLDPLVITTYDSLAIKKEPVFGHPSQVSESPVSETSTGAGEGPEAPEAPTSVKPKKKVKADKAVKAPKEPKAPKAPKVPKEPKAPKAPKAPKVPKEPKAPREPGYVSKTKVMIMDGKPEGVIKQIIAEVYIQQGKDLTYGLGRAKKIFADARKELVGEGKLQPSASMIKSAGGKKKEATPAPTPEETTENPEKTE